MTSRGRKEKEAASPAKGGAQPKGYASPFSGQSEAEKEAFRAYLRSLQALGEASEVLYLAERASRIAKESAPEIEKARYGRAEEAAAQEWYDAVNAAGKATCEALGHTQARTERKALH